METDPTFYLSRFQALLKTYEQLAELILHSIRIDVRCRTIYCLDAAMRHVLSSLAPFFHILTRFLKGNYYIDHEAGEPDPHVIDLNAELGKCDDLIATTLPKKEQQ
jgi:exocyst complex component 4